MSKNVLTAAERIEAKFGGKWEKAGGEILTPPASISTGSLLMDEAIGDCKGYPEGSVIEVYGPQHSGKTLMGYLAIASSQRKNPDRDHLIIDAENQFKYQSRWAKQLGVDVPNLYVKPVISGEEAFDIIEMAILGDVQLNSDGEVTKVIKPGNFGIIMVDSVTQLVPLELVHKGMDESQRMGLVAAMMSKGLKKILSAMILAKSKTIIIFINQTRMNPQAAKLHCMHSWTRIHTLEKDYAIGNFVRKKINDTIVTYNEEKERFEKDKVVSYFDNGLTFKEDFIKIYFQTPSHRKYQQIVCTKDHQILTKLGWKQAQQLSKNDFLIGYCENNLSKNQEQILLGTMLGDGFLHKSTLKASLRLENSEQPKYLKWKVDRLSCLNFKKSNDRFDSEYSLCLKNYYDMFYENNTTRELKEKTGKSYRTFSLEVFEKINILALAIFYLDDGSLIANDLNSPKDIIQIGSKRFRHLKSDFFENLLKSFKQFGLKGSLLANGYSIRLNKASSYRFSNMIKEFVIPEMQYKLFEEHRNSYNHKLFIEKPFVKFDKIYVNVIKTTSIKKEEKTLRKFDIQTKNHTYMVGSAKDFSGIVVHNCNPESRTGGTALPFYDTISFRVSKVKGSEERDDRGKIFAHQAKIKFDKNKVGGLPAEPIIIRIRYDGTGIDQEAELMSVAELNGMIFEFKRGKFNFVKPETEELLDESIEMFKRDDFGTILNSHSNIKQLIQKFIQEGKFYSSNEVEEDNPDVSEVDSSQQKELEPVKQEETQAVVEEKNDDQTIRRKRRSE